jgi:hypothetical protein
MIGTEFQRSLYAFVFIGCMIVITLALGHMVWGWL